MNKEASIGIGVVVIWVTIVGYNVGVNGLFFVGVMFAAAMLALLLYSRKSMVAKGGAILVFPEILTKFLMPKSAKHAINKLNEKENKT